jgi:hypothetical protein
MDLIWDIIIVVPLAVFHPFRGRILDSVALLKKERRGTSDALSILQNAQGDNFSGKPTPLNCISRVRAVSPE